MKNIGVIGAHFCNEELFKKAFKVGKLIATNNFILICGGLSGVMEASCKGAKDAGGTTVGILPGDSICDANKYIDIPIATGMGHARNVIIARSSDALIAVGGGYGTLSEIALSIKMGKKVLTLDSWKIDGVINCKNIFAIEKFLKEIGK